MNGCNCEMYTSDIIPEEVKEIDGQSYRVGYCIACGSERLTEIKGKYES